MIKRLAGIAALLVLSGAAHAQRLDARRPNIVILVADDMGFSDLSCYGSEILTPHINEMAKEGLRFTQFYNCGRGCPTRASLLTGLWPHQTGVGHMMTDYGMKYPGYRGNLNRECATIAEVLGQSGYQTYMAGKWHLSRHTAPEGPKHNWPLQRGFDRFYGTIHGWGSYFDPATLTRDNHFVKAEGDFYYTEAISEHAAMFIEQAARSDRPFFLYAAFTAPHWPLHARPADVEQYRGRFVLGWDGLRQNRYKLMSELGLIKGTWALPPRDSRVLPWSEVPYKEWHQRRMEVYAAQITSMDQGVGRILQKLRQVNQIENTLVMFLADNGASAEEILPSWKDLGIPSTTRSGRGVMVGNHPNTLPGPEATYQSYGVPWATVSNTPFRFYKKSMHEGGIATPLVVYWPAVIRTRLKIVHEPGHVVDVMPTCVELAGIDYPSHYAGQPIKPPEGQSLLPIFYGRTRERGPMFWEHEGNRAVRDGQWKLVASQGGRWELYDLEADRTEMNDLAATRPDIVSRLSTMYESWTKRCNVATWGRNR